MFYFQKGGERTCGVHELICIRKGKQHFVKYLLSLRIVSVSYQLLNVNALIFFILVLCICIAKSFDADNVNLKKNNNNHGIK